jgi:endoglucanase
MRAIPHVLGAVMLVSLAACGGSSGVSGIARQSPTARATTSVTAAGATATATSAAKGLVVQGTQLLSDGSPLTLIGADRSSLEYSCTGDGHYGLADFQAMAGWGMNVVRITLSSEFWANAEGACPNYHQTVNQAVALARSAGLFVILDLQWSAPLNLAGDATRGGDQCPMPDTGKDVAFWHDLATTYRSDGGVLFDLYGEPFGISWTTWRDGGTISSGCYIIQGSTSPLIAGTYRAIGMQALVNDVRAIAPTNVIILGGLSWGYDLSGVSKGFALKGTNLMYDTHPFDYGGKQPSDWPASFGATAEKYAVIVDEFGSYSCGTSYISQAMSYFNQHHLSWLAWAWNLGGCGGPSLLSAWPDTPSAPYGTTIRQQMLSASKR